MQVLFTLTTFRNMNIDDYQETPIYSDIG
jgi:hypothetical protein